MKKHPGPEISTALIHHDYVAPEGFEAIQPAIHKASTVLFPDVQSLHARTWQDKSAYTYGLHGTPTTFTLEARIASLEGAKHCVLAPSGLSAIALVNVAVLSAGDEVAIPDNAYGPGKNLAEHELKRWGITPRWYDAMQPDSLRAVLSDRTKLVWLEAPGSITLEFPNLHELISLCQAAGILTALDNTWGAGLAFCAFDLEGLAVDISVHALTKYPSGGGDVLMGSVCSRRDDIHEQITMTHSRLGLGVGANDVELVLRGLNSLPLRYAAQDASTRQLAHWLSQHPAVHRVLHPALVGSPGHEHWQRWCSQAASLVTVEFSPHIERTAIEQALNAMRLFRLGYSWGGPMSLVVPYSARHLRQLPHDYQGTLVRFAVGLENVHDLQHDLEQSFQFLSPS